MTPQPPTPAHALLTRLTQSAASGAAEPAHAQDPDLDLDVDAPLDRTVTALFGAPRAPRAAAVEGEEPAPEPARSRRTPDLRASRADADADADADDAADADADADADDAAGPSDTAPGRDEPSRIAGADSVAPSEPRRGPGLRGAEPCADDGDSPERSGSGSGFEPAESQRVSGLSVAEEDEDAAGRVEPQRGGTPGRSSGEGLRAGAARGVADVSVAGAPDAAVRVAVIPRSGGEVAESSPLAPERGESRGGADLPVRGVPAARGNVARLVGPADDGAAPPSAGPDRGAAPREGVSRIADFRVGARGKGAGPEETRRRGPADPVRGVMHRHEALIAGAVDEWEIAAGLEAHGVTDADARRLRHRDVFGLAEELYARVPRAVRPVEAVPGEGEREHALPRWRVGAVQAAPGALCALAAGVEQSVRMPLVAALLAACVAVALWAALRTGPLRVERGAGAAAWAYGLLAFALYGPQAGTAFGGHGAFDATAGTATFTALTITLLPAAYCAHWLAVRSRAQLAPSHGLSDFADAVRPRLAAALAAYAVALIVLLNVATAAAGSAPLAGPAALGLLLFVARLLSVHGFPGHVAAGLGAACAAEALTLAAAPLHLGPGGATAEAVICGAAALALTAQVFRVLPRASAHRPPPRHP